MAIHAWSQQEKPGEQINWVALTGWPDDLACTLNRRIGAFSGNGGFHRKIGITNDPQRRWQQAYRNNGWYRMHVLYQSSSHDHVCVLERHVVNRFDSQVTEADGYYYNATGGGGGRKPNFGPYFLYLVVAPRWSRITIDTRDDA